MKQKVVISFLLGLLLLLHPVMPYIEYFTFKDFIAKNLCIEKDVPNSCCKGKCYLEERIKESNENPTKKDHLPFKVKTEVLQYYNITDELLSIAVAENKTFVSFQSIGYKYLCVSNVFHPPQYSNFL